MAVISKKKKTRRKREKKNGTWTIIQCQTIQMSSKIQEKSKCHRCTYNQAGMVLAKIQDIRYVKHKSF